MVGFFIKPTTNTSTASAAAARPTKAQIQAMINKSKSTLATMNLDPHTKKQLEEKLNHANTHDLINVIIETCLKLNQINLRFYIFKLYRPIGINFPNRKGWPNMSNASRYIVYTIL